MRLPLLVCLRFFSLWGIPPHSKVTGACPVTTDSIMRVTVRTTTIPHTIKLNLSKLKMCKPDAMEQTRQTHGLGARTYIHIYIFIAKQNMAFKPYFVQGK